MKKTALVRRSKFLKRNKKLRRISPKQKERLARYLAIQKKFLRDNPWCVVCAMLKGRQVPATECHHVRGRAGSLLFDTRFMMASCRSCRLTPHQNPKWAREVGILAEACDWGKVPI